MSRGSVTRRAGQTSWRARYRDADGREHQRSFERKGLADRWLREQLSALHRGDWIDPTAGALRFEVYARQWLGHQHVREATRRNHELRVRSYLVPTLGTVPLRAIRRSHVLEVVRRCSVDLELSPLVVRYAVGTLKAILDSAVADRLIVENVARDRSISLPKPERASGCLLDAELVTRIAERIDDRFRAMLTLAVATGLRPGELRAVSVDRISPQIHLTDADLTPRQAVVRVDRQLNDRGELAPVKTASSRREVSLDPVTVGALIEHVRTYGVGQSGLLFTTSTGRKLTSGDMSAIWAAATRGLSVPEGASWHDCRHLHASTLLGEGINPAAVAKRLGHATAAITLGVYAWALKEDQDRIVEASEKIARRFA